MVGGMPAPEVGRVLPLWLTVVLGVAGTAGAVWGIHAGARILGPIFLAFVLTVVAHPIIGALVRRGVRRAFAVAIAVLVVDGGLIALRPRPRRVLRPARDRAARVLRRVAAPPGRPPVHAGRRGDRSGSRSRTRCARSQPQSVLSAVGGILGGLAGSLGALVLVLATVLFMTAEGAGLPDRLAEVPGTWRLRSSARRLRTEHPALHRGDDDLRLPRGGRGHRGPRAARGPARAAVGAGVVPDQLRPEHRVLPRPGAAHAAGVPRRWPRTRRSP